MEAKKTLRLLLEGFTELRTGSNDWEPIGDAPLDDPVPEDTRYEREGNLLKVYALNPVSLHWYVSGKYELR